MILIVHHIDLRLSWNILWQLFLYKEHFCLLGTSNYYRDKKENLMCWVAEKQVVC